MLFNLAQSLRSLTASPASTAVDQAHRMARRRLEAGGAATSARDRVEEEASRVEFVLPPDIDPAEVASAIEAKLSGGRRSRAERGDIRMAFRPAPGGKVVVPAEVIQRLGDGAIDRGKRVLGTIISEIRARRALKGSW